MIVDSNILIKKILRRFSKDFLNVFHALFLRESQHSQVNKSIACEEWDLFELRLRSQIKKTFLS